MFKKLLCLVLAVLLIAAFPFGALAQEETVPEETAAPETVPVVTEAATEPATEVTTEPPTEPVVEETTEATTAPTQPQATEPVPEPTEPVQTTEPAVTESVPETSEPETEEESEPVKLMSDEERAQFWAKVQAEKKSRAKATTESQRIRYQIIDTYNETLYRTRRVGLKGYCGLQVSWQLYLLGINSSLRVMDGNAHYDAYCNLETTSGGYGVTAYPASQYSMEEALNKLTNNGTEDVYNIMVGFQQTTTDAGQKYGHVSMIHAVLDGKVYFVEGFPTPYSSQEGQPIVLSISQYAAYWQSWTTYEGLVYFGNGGQSGNIRTYETDLVLEAQQAVSVYQDADCEAVYRQLLAGERVNVDAIVRNRDGIHLYRITDDGKQAYVAPENMTVILYPTDDLTVEEPDLPQALEVGEGFNASGKVTAQTTQIAAVYVTVTNEDGEKVLRFEKQTPGTKYDLKKAKLDLSQLPQGRYTYAVTAETYHEYISDDTVNTHSQTVYLTHSMFTVGQPGEAEKLPEIRKTGWVYKQGTWYYYENSQPKTGWICSNGVDYYLQEDGSVTTGWAQINGKARYFSPTGAMRTGWAELEEGKFYLLRNGVAAKGWMDMDGGKYYFREDGSLCAGGWFRLEDKLCYLDETGKAAVGWVDLPEGRFSFHPDGYLLSKSEDGKVIPYDGTWSPIEE